MTAQGEPNFGKWSDFLQDLRNSFKPYDKEGDALDEIIRMRQGNTSIEDHVAKFKVLLADSGVTKDSPAALNYFQKSIRVPLLKKILDQDNVAVLRLQTIKTIVNSHRFKGSSSDEPRRVQVLDLYCLTRFESENSRRGDVY